MGNDDSGFYIIMIPVGFIIIFILAIVASYYDGNKSDKNLDNSNFTNEWLSSKKVEDKDTTDYIRTIEVINKDTGKKYKLYIHSIHGDNPWYGIEEDN